MKLPGGCRWRLSSSQDLLKPLHIRGCAVAPPATFDCFNESSTASSTSELPMSSRSLETSPLEGYVQTRHLEFYRNSLFRTGQIASLRLTGNLDRSLFKHLASSREKLFAQGESEQRRRHVPSKIQFTSTRAWPFSRRSSHGAPDILFPSHEMAPSH